MKQQALVLGSLLSLGLMNIARADDTPAPAAGVGDSATPPAASTDTPAVTPASSATITADSAPSVVATTDTGWKRPKLAGFSFGVDLSEDSSINAEPENYNNVVSMGFNVGWSFGKLLIKKGYFAPLSASAGFTLQDELAGNSDLFRTANGPSNFIANVPEAFTLSQEGGVLLDPNGVPRRVSGNSKRINYSDISVGLSHAKLATLPAKIKLSGAMRWVLPTSVSSQAVELYTMWNTKLSAKKTFLAGDKLSLGYSLGFTKFFHKYTTAGINHAGGSDIVFGEAVTPAEFINNGGGRLTEFGFSNGVNVGYQATPKLSASLSYAINSSFTYAISNCNITLPDGTQYDTCRATATNTVSNPSSGRGARDSQVFSVGVGYDLKDWVSLGLTLTTAEPLRSLDGHSLRQPFFSTDRNGFTSVGASASFQLDSLM